MGAVLPTVFLFLFWDVCVSVQTTQPDSPPKEAWSCSEDLATNVTLECPSASDWLHVSEISRFPGNCTTGQLLGTGTQHKPYSDDCLGPQPNTSARCIVHVAQDELQSTTADYNVTKAKYSCIEESLIHNICGNISVTATGGDDLYLASPGFFGSGASVSDSPSCQCHITGVTSMLIIYWKRIENLDISCNNCSERELLRSLLGRTVHNEQIVLNAPLVGDCTVDITFHNQSLSYTEHSKENKAWIQVTGTKRWGMRLQCNGGLETDITQTSTVESITTPALVTDRTEEPSSNQASSSSVGLHVYILGGVAGLSLLLAVTMIIVVLVCGTCGRKEEKEPPPDVKFADPGLDLQHDEHGYCIVNKNRKEAEAASPPEATSSPLDTKSKPKWLKWKLFNRSETNGSGRQTVSANHRAKSEENADTGTLTMNQARGGDKPVYQILEPDPNTPQERDIVLVEVPIPRGPKSVKLSAPHTEESTPRGSLHVYSEVGDTSGASVECSSTENSAKGGARPKKPPKPKSLPPKPKDTRKPKVPLTDSKHVYNEITPEESVSPKTYHVLEPDPNEPQEKDLVFIPVQKGKGVNFQQSAADKTDSLDSRNLHLYADLDDVEIEGSGAAMSESNSCPVSNTPAGRARPAGGLLTGQTSQTLNNETSASRTDSFHAYADVGDCQVSTDDKNATSSESRDTTDDRNMTSSKSRDKKPGASLYEEVEITPERKMSMK